MTTVETKIELVTEAIEAITLAQVVLCSGALDEHDRVMAAKNLTDARAVLSKALKVLLTPSLRVINNDHPEHVPFGGAGIDGMNLA